MASKTLNLKSKILNLPHSPGVYQFLDNNGEVLYIGKAKNLRARVKQYFEKTDKRPQIPFLMKEAKKLDYTITNTELESLYLERTLIQTYKPKYNIDLRDDKNYAFITINFGSEIPQFGYARKFDPLNKHVKYFGPFTAAGKIKETLNLVRKIFSYCLAEKVSHKPCFYFHLHKCPGVCIGKISINEYKKHLEKIVSFLKGKTALVEKSISWEMIKAAKQKKFETAARLRDQLRALKSLEEKQNVILNKKVDWDIISFALANETACVNLFKIRGGKMFDKENFVYKTIIAPQRHSDADLSAEESQPKQKEILPLHQVRGQDDTAKEILQTFCEQYYLETSSMPKIIYTQEPMLNGKLIPDIIKFRFLKSAKIISPKKGQAKKLVNLGKINAKEYLQNWLNNKAENLNKINTALVQLKEVLNLKQIPKRIECFDISNIQGTNAVGSMVVFENGLPKKNEYRKFKIRIIPPAHGPDDFAMMKEMLSRRFSRRHSDAALSAEESQPKQKKTLPPHKVQGQDNARWKDPNLIVIDGGRGQLSAALSALQALPTGQAGTGYKLIPILGLAKRIEEIFIPEKKDPVILSHDQPALKLLQRLRDEAHRFGLSFHRNLRSKQAVKSALDDIPGIGPKTKKLLKQKIGTVADIKKASADELTKVVGLKLATVIKQSL